MYLHPRTVAVALMLIGAALQSLAYLPGLGTSSAAIAANASVSISGTKFYDFNGNGEWDGSEGGLPGWIILAEPGSYSALTDIDGHYRLLGLPAGTYAVGEMPQEGWEQSYPHEPGNHTITLLEGESAAGVNFGNHPAWQTGDVNCDGGITSGDIIELVRYVFKGGRPPVIFRLGDTTCDGSITSSDIIFLVNHVFKSGPAPACG